MQAKKIGPKAENLMEEAEETYGRDYADLYLWARENGHSEIFNLIYYGFEFSNSRIDPNRIIEEVKLYGGVQIISGWSDSNVASSIFEYFNDFNASSLDKRSFAREPNADLAKKIPKSLEQSGYLLALASFQPFLSSYPKTSYYQTLLRLWLITHGLYRLKGNRAYDSLVSHVARYLIVSYDDFAKIELLERLFKSIDQLLNEAKISFEDTNSAINAAAQYILLQHNTGLKQGQKNFLYRLSRISNYESEPISSDDNRILTTLSALNVEPLAARKLPALSFQDEGFEVLFTESVGEDSEEDEPEDNAFLTLSTTADKTSAEQIATGYSVYIDRAEQAHFLPWSWDKVLPTEATALNTWLNAKLTAQNTLDALPAAIILLALQFGRSLENILRVSIGQPTEMEWGLDLDSGTAHRQAVRRHSAYQPKLHEKEWLASVKEKLAVPISKQVTSVLRASINSLEFKPTNIAQLWAAYYSEQLFVWFNQNTPKELKRLKSSMIAKSLGQSIFNRTSDTSLARAWASHPQNALPAACGYGSWEIDELLKGEAPTARVKSQPSTSLVGSRLVVLEKSLQRYIKELNEYVGQAQTQVEFHNRFTYYTVQALNAATGARYLTEPFESLSRFYFDNGDRSFPSCVFINDKEDDIHSGRLVPLCSQVKKLVADYLDHLAQLAQATSEICPSFSGQINQLLMSKPVQLPLFFLVDNKLQWQSLSNLELLENLPYFPLPKNTFRHRFSQQMTSLGLPSDVLEGWMGHGERGMSAYGDFSPRCWKADALAYLNLLEKSFKSLGFDRITHSNANLPLGAAEVQDISPNASSFGEKKRKESREKTLKAIQKLTHKKIESFLNGRQWSEISADEFEGFASRFGKGEDGSIAPTYPLERMSALRNSLEEAQSPLLQHIKERYISLKQETNHLNPTVISALYLLSKIKGWCEQNSQIYPKDLSLKQSTQLGVVLLAVEKQLSYLGMLTDIADGENFQLVQFKRECFLRYSEELEQEDLTSAAQLHRISYKTASFLNALKGSKNKINSRETLAFKPLEELALIMGLSPDCLFDELLLRLSEIIEQANLVVLPGMVAAGLSHRQPPTSLSLYDYVRINSRMPLVAPVVADEAAGIELSQLMPVSIQWLGSTNSVLKKEASEFHKKISEIISEYEPSKTKANVCAGKIENLSKDFSNRVSTAVLAVGYWFANTISVGKYQGRRKSFVPLAKSSVETYWGTLITAFKELAYNIDVLSLSEDEFYPLYRKMLNYKREKGNKTEYFGNRLQTYHKFLTAQGAPTLDWSELDFEDRARNVSSGFITERDFQNTLQYLDKKFADKSQTRVLQFILLLGYRFGLRVQEAACLLRTDWIEDENGIHLLVRNNKYRALKSEHGRRAIPLLFELTGLEHKIIKAVFDQYEINSGNNLSELILSDIRGGETVLNPICYAASREIITALREVTGNPKLVLHHARHSFYNRIAAIMFGINTKLTQKVNVGLDTQATIKTLLGPSHALDRRASMAIAIVMGHKHASTSLKSYNHLITEWADELLPLAPSKTHQLSEAIQLDAWEKWQAPKIQHTEKIEFVLPSVQTLIQVMRLVALGKTFEQAVHIVGLHPNHANQLEVLAAEGFIKEEANLPEKITENSILGVREFLSHVSDTAWKRLLSGCDKEYDFNPRLSINLDELPLLIGNKRQILMEKDQHFQLIKRLVDYFDLPSQSYGISIYPKSLSAIEKVQDYNLSNALIANKPIDVMRQREAGQRGAILQDYASFWLKDRLSDTLLRNSYEVAIGILVIGYLSFCD